MQELQPGYVSLELDEILWRTRTAAVIAYRMLGHTHYPPGTFTMLWVPRLEAIPMTPIQHGATLYFIVKARGPTTRRLVEEPPRYAAAIGPLGREFRPEARRLLHVAGGVGVAAALSAAKAAPGPVAYGARSSDELIPLDELGIAPKGVELHYATEDGSLGYRGTALELATELAKTTNIEGFTVAGPPPMLCTAAERLAEAPLLYLAPETTVRCGLGFCGRCSLGCGPLLCRDGIFLERHELECWLVRQCAASAYAGASMTPPRG